MASQVPGFTASFGDLAIALLSAAEVIPRARMIAQHECELFPGSGVVVYLLDQGDEPRWLPKAAAGQVSLVDDAVPFEEGTLGAMAGRNEAVVFAGADLPREAFAHLHTRRTLNSLAAVPLFSSESLIGAIEVLSFDTPLGSSALDALLELARIAGQGLAAAMAYESERNNQLESVTRLAQLYDLEKVFNSTLELDELAPLITSKFRELLRVQAVNLWMVEGDGVLLMSRTGEDPTTNVGDRQTAGEGMVGDIADAGESVLIESPEDERLRVRNAHAEEGAIFSIITAPLMSDGAEVGVVEAINKMDGTPFDDDDLFFLTTICETAANALHNASLLQAERKVEILQTLVTVSQELTSTLNLDRVLEAVVNRPGAVIPYEGAAVALEQRGKLQVRAVSGMSTLVPGDPQVARLKDILEWASLMQDEVHVTQREGVIDSERAETRSKFEKYFSETGMNAFYAVPLADDDGRLGVLAFESSDPDFLGTAHLEMIKVLVGQVTVALRNASLYKEVPLIGVIEPLMQQKRKFLALEKRRRTTFIAAAAAVVLFLVFFPIPMRVDGEATVQPVHKAEVEPEIDGVVRQVFVREGQQVRAGDVLADLEDWNYRDALAAAQAKYETALSQMNRALAANDGTEAGIQRVQANYWASEVDRARQRVEKTHLRAPIDGSVATPHIEDSVGRQLSAGAKFGEIVDNSQAIVDVAVDDVGIALLRDGARGWLKLDGFPTRTFKGAVSVISPKSEVQGDSRVFFARLAVPNPNGLMRAGMQGRAKISAGWRSVGYVLFRRPAVWVYTKLWIWFGW